MNDYMILSVGLLLPFLGTALGASTVFFFKHGLGQSSKRLLLGFASGVMIAATVWSLLIPSIDMATEQGGIPWLPAVLGFLLGIGFLLCLDSIIPHLHLGEVRPEGPKSSLSRSTMLILAVTLHNIPEGMAVGVMFAGALSGEYSLSMASAFALSIGIAIQNVPEGAVISLPLVGKGRGRAHAFGLGALSGIVEPAGAILTILMTSLITPLLPYLLSFAAGAMFYVVIEELIPECQEGTHSNLGILGAAFGFVLMMVLDVALG